MGRNRNRLEKDSRYGDAGAIGRSFPSGMGRSAAASKPRVLLDNKQGTFGRPAFYRPAKMRQKKMCNFGDAPIPAPGVPSLPGELAIGVEAEKLVPRVKWVPSGASGATDYQRSGRPGGRFFLCKCRRSTGGRRE